MRIILLALILTTLFLPIRLETQEGSHFIEIIEYYTPDSFKVELTKVIDGDTVDVSFQGKSLRVRIVGYDAFELSEDKGPEAKAFLENLCLNSEVYLDVDDLEPKDKYNRTLGYLWCKKDNEVNYLPVTKAFLVLRPDLVKRTLYIPPDEYPYFSWLAKYEVRITSDADLTLRIYNVTGKYELKGRNFSLNLTGSYYLLRSNIFLNATAIDLLKNAKQSITIVASASLEKTFTETVTSSKTITFTETLLMKETETFENTITLMITLTQSYFPISEISVLLLIILIIIAVSVAIRRIRRS